MRVELYTDSFTALGGSVEVALASTTSQTATTCIQQIRKEVLLFERRFSRFIPGSELSMCNKRAGLKTYVSNEFMALLLQALILNKETEGMFNPFVLPALQRAGYVQSALNGYEHDAVDDHQTKHVVSMDRLQHGEDWIRIPHGTALDFGGIGKGYIGEQLREVLDVADIKGYRVALSGDIITYGVDAAEEPWKIHIQDAKNINGTLDEVIECPTTNFAVATSGSFKRPGQTGDWHHIIDPRIEKPARTDISTITLCDASLLRADVFATCAIIVGSKKATQFLQKHGIKRALIQSRNIKYVGSIKNILKVDKEAVYA